MNGTILIATDFHGLLQGELSGNREMFESLCGLNRIHFPNSRETGCKTTMSAPTGEYACPPGG
jgi:hypothetical protein